jgi:hypothetical protein
VNLISRTCVGLLLLIVTGALCIAQTTAPAGFSQEKLQAAFDRLAADEAADRENAQDQIVQMGPAAIEPLKALIATASDVEQRTGAQAALARIQQVAQVGATSVTLNLNNVTSNQAFSELSKISGYPIRVSNPDGNRRISLEIKNEPFWAALHQLCKTAGYSLQNQGNGQLSVSQGSGYLNGPVYVDGPFMIMARSINLSSHVQLQQRNAGNKSMSVQFMCFVEPKLQISQRPYQVQLTECTDDQGRSLILNNNPGMFFGGMGDAGGQAMWDTNAPLQVPEPDASRITVLKGNIRLMAAIKTENLEIEDILSAKNVTKSAAGYSLTVKSVTTNGDQVTVVMSLAFPPNRRNAYQMLQQVKLLDASDNQMQVNNTNGPNSGNNRLDYRVTYQRRNGDEKRTNPAKLVLSVPTESKPLDFSFEFKDLPLPK